MKLLLDQGACASDVHFLPRRWGHTERSKGPCGAVITLASQWERSELVHRLIDGGADVHAKTRHDGNFFLNSNFDNDILRVTALFTGSLKKLQFLMIRLVYLTKALGLDQTGLLIYCACVECWWCCAPLVLERRVLWTGRPAMTSTARNLK